jgi:ferritin
MIKNKLEEAVNKQIQVEFQSAYQYLAFSAYFEEENLNGFAHWMQVQWQEEIEHAMKFYNHILRRGGSVELLPIEQPKVDSETTIEVFDKVLKQEQYVTKRIHELYDLARDENDYPLQTLLHWFIDEQVEEEEMASDILDRLKMIGEHGPSLYLLDQEMGSRQPGEEDEGALA